MILKNREDGGVPGLSYFDLKPNTPLISARNAVCRRRTRSIHGQVARTGARHMHFSLQTYLSSLSCTPHRRGGGAPATDTAPTARPMHALWPESCALCGQPRTAGGCACVDAWHGSDGTVRGEGSDGDSRGWTAACVLVSLSRGDRGTNWPGSDRKHVWSGTGTPSSSGASRAALRHH
jgi:hypothetical protein